jgi:hypothetical protein
MINEFNGINEIIVRHTGVIVVINIDHYRGIIKVRMRKDNKFGFIGVKGQFVSPKIVHHFSERNFKWRRMENKQFTYTL